MVSSLADSISKECPRLKLNDAQKEYIKEGIRAGIHRLRGIQTSDIIDVYENIPEDSGKTAAALDIVLTGLRIVKEHKETDSSL